MDVDKIAKETTDRWPDGTGEHLEPMLVRAGIVAGLREAARKCETIAWSNRNSPLLGPEQNAMTCAKELTSAADAIEKGAEHV